MIKKKEERSTDTDTKNITDTIIQIQKIRFLPIQNKNVPANNEHFADLNDSTSEPIPTSIKKLRMDHIKTKIKYSTDNHKNDRVHNMNQNNSYTETNDKNRKHTFSNITKHNKNPKAYSSSQNGSVGIQ